MLYGYYWPRFFESLLVSRVPGLAKITYSNDTLSLDLTSNRIQFTPDLMPSDILARRPDQNRNLKFIKGPIFPILSWRMKSTVPRLKHSRLYWNPCRIYITIGKKVISPPTFLVLATQNPIEQEELIRSWSATRPFHVYGDPGLSELWRGRSKLSNKRRPSLERARQVLSGEQIQYFNNYLEGARYGQCRKNAVSLVRKQTQLPMPIHLPMNTWNGVPVLGRRRRWF